MAAPPNPRLTAQEYLEIERSAKFKSEFLNGDILAMSGGSLNHSLIATSTSTALKQAVRGSGCTVFNSDMRVGIDSSAYFYPDVSIVCGKPEVATPQEDVLTNPIVIVEVLSPSTEAYDRGVKFHAYSRLDSLRHYLLVSQSGRTVDILSRRENVWIFETVTEGELRLESIDVAISIEDLYDQVSLPG